MIDFGDPRSRHWPLMKRETMPPQSMLARHMEALIRECSAARGDRQLAPDRPRMAVRRSGLDRARRGRGALPPARGGIAISRIDENRALEELKQADPVMAA